MSDQSRDYLGDFEARHDEHPSRKIVIANRTDLRYRSIALRDSKGQWFFIERIKALEENKNDAAKLEPGYSSMVTIWYPDSLSDVYAVRSNVHEESHQLNPYEKQAVMRMHINMGHPPARELVRHLRNAGA